MKLFAERGYGDTSLRAVATEAGVSHGLVIHHYGSKEGLRAAANSWVTERLMANKERYFPGGPMPSMTDFAASLGPDVLTIRAYLARSLREGGELGSTVFTMLCEFSETAQERLGAAGVMRVPSDPTANAVIFAALTSALWTFETDIAARLGGESMVDPSVLLRYSAAFIELLDGGVFTDPEYLATIRQTLGIADGKDRP